MIRRAVPVFVLAVVAGACAAPRPPVVDFSEKQRDYRAQDYEEVYKRWTRHHRAMRDMDAVLEVWATFKSWDFREAYIERYAAAYSLSETDRATLRRAQLEANRRGYEFHLTAQSTDYKLNDLEKSSSAWRVTLIDAMGREIAPEYVKVEKLPEAYESAFFPSKTPFTKTYAISFSAGAGGETDFAGPRSGSVTLRITSPIGRIDATWQGG